MVPRVTKNRMGVRAFRYQAHGLLNLNLYYRLIAILVVLGINHYIYV